MSQGTVRVPTMEKDSVNTKTMEKDRVSTKTMEKDRVNTKAMEKDRVNNKTMERERVNIKMQRHLRPLTTASKASTSRSSTRPNTAGAELTNGTGGTSTIKPRSSRVTKQSLRESHLQVSWLNIGMIIFV